MYLRFAAVLTLLLGLALAGRAQEACNDCHSDPALTMQGPRGTVSVTVTPDSLKGSVHEGLACTDCHTDLKTVAEFPHGPVAPVNCGGCHERAMQQFMTGFFKKLNDMGYRGIPACSDCHGAHQIARRADTRRVCGICHQAELRTLEASVHGVSSPTDERPLVCTSCHEPHFKTRRGTMSDVDWQGFLVQGCQRCHKPESEDYLHSRHHQALMEGDTLAPNCLTCHGSHNVLAPSNPAAPTSVARMDNLCAQCHSGYLETLHIKDGADPRLMTCAACHTGHETQMTRTAGHIERATIPATCNECHGAERHAKQSLAHGQIMLVDPATGEAANCTQCHVYHWQKGGATHEAALRMQCQNCHAREAAEYAGSEHAVARAKGHAEAPDCITCHGERNIPRVAEALNPRAQIDLCSRCHGNREIALKFQLNPDVVKSYKKTYHGQVYNLGYQGAEFATCVNCHGNHDIRSQDDPASAVSRQNIVATCARCHKDANEKFVGFLSHYDPHGGPQGPLAGARRVSRAESFMNTLLLVTFGVFGTHNILWLIRELMESRRKPRPPHGVARKYIQRFTPWQRFLHILMVASFLLLAATGLPLKFSHSEIAYWLAQHMASLRVAAIAHRVGAVMTFTYFGLHLGSLLFKAFVKREKGLFWGPNSLVPNKQDVVDFVGNIKWFLGKGERPRFGRWTYWEKFDYLAVFWGVTIIGLSGLVLWFPEFFTRLLPGWTINLAHIVHSEEALLAVGFIFTIHFFNSHLRPSKFPFDDVIFTGRESIEELDYHRPAELERLEALGGMEEHMVGPMPLWRRRALQLFGWAAFAAGIILLIFIVTSMVF